MDKTKRIPAEIDIRSLDYNTLKVNFNELISSADSEGLSRFNLNLVLQNTAYEKEELAPKNGEINNGKPDYKFYSHLKNDVEVKKFIQFCLRDLYEEGNIDTVLANMKELLNNRANSFAGLFYSLLNELLNINDDIKIEIKISELMKIIEESYVIRGSQVEG